MGVRITNHLDSGAVNALLMSPSGGVARDLLRRGKHVESRAKQNLANSPRRIDTGRLRSSITTVLVRAGGNIAVQVGTNVEYARFVHDGTRYMAANPFLKDALPAAKN